MTGNEVVRRLRAFERGRPLPAGETLRVHRLDSNQVMILAFVKMGGESAPWGVAYGRSGKPPKLLTVAEPRTRDEVATMMLELAPVLLTHLHHPQFSPFGPDPEARIPPFQIWVPNDAHLEMLHHLAYAYTFTKFGETARWQRLRALGRACGWLFRESQRPGQTIAISAATVLADAFTFPAETTRQGHLGFLLSWLQAKGGKDPREAAAAEAERLSISTNLDPAVERDELAPYVEMYNEARKSGDAAQLERGRRRIQKVLEEELRRRYSLTESALDCLRSDRRRENSGLATLEKESMTEHHLQYRRLEQCKDDGDDGPAFTPSPETDRHPAAAASRFYVQEASQDQLESVLVHDDREIQAQLIASGQAVAGTITDVWDEGEGRKTRPVWALESKGDLPLRIREDSALCLVGLPARQVRVRTIERTTGGYRFELEVTSLITVPRKGDGSVLPATSPKLKRKKIVLVKPAMDQIARRKSRMVWNADVPGAWLTHTVPKVLAANLPRGVGEDLSEIDR